MSHSAYHSLPTTLEESDEYRGGSVLGPVDRDSYAIHKQRKAASTGGGRAWTEEEENYLLRTRSNKMPYKHIAAHLNKTELACRLHYHQMSYGSSRRKRTGSVSSTCSTSSYGSTFNPMTTLRESSPEHVPYNTLSPIASPPSSPESTTSGLAPLRTGSPNMMQRPILPKPIMTSARPSLPSPAELSKSLHLDTSVAQHKDFIRRNAHIDIGRLRAVYAAHRDAFWTQVAQHYSITDKFSGSELEDAFLAGHNVVARRYGSSPPTPEPSPHTGTAASFRSLPALTPGLRSEMLTAPSPTERCAVSGLLN